MEEGRWKWHVACKAQSTYYLALDRKFAKPYSMSVTTLSSNFYLPKYWFSYFPCSLSLWVYVL